jgi:ankyrin repeat protein
MSPPQLHIDILLSIGYQLLTADEGDRGFANFNSFIKANHELYACGSRTLWRKAAQSTAMTTRAFTHLIRTNNLPRLRLFLEMGADIETTLQEFVDEGSEITKTTPLKAAVSLDNVPMARLFLDHGAEIVVNDRFGSPGYSAIHAARSASMVELLLEHHADPEQQDSSTGYRPLHFYSKRGTIDAMWTLLHKGVEPNAFANPTGTDYTDYLTPLDHALRSGIDAVLLLLHYGAQLYQIHSGDTPLHSAARAGSLEIVRLFLGFWPEGIRSMGADLYVPLHEAAQAGKTAVVKFLLDSWPEGQKARDTFGRTPLLVAAEAGQLEVMRLLMEKWPESAMELDEHGSTPFRVIAQQGEKNEGAVMRMLLEFWPDAIRERDDDGRTLLHDAAIFGKSNVMTVLLQHWPEAARERDVEGNTPLHCASGYCETEAMWLLQQSWPESMEEYDAMGRKPLSVFGRFFWGYE